ncbi:MAG: NUDIX domain-containing protein [Candidatus Micrarchaeota archaeon]|nr:NUDIX domain-containing protein [Candidatus Micrarchaeota archaeon]
MAQNGRFKSTLPEIKQFSVGAVIVTKEETPRVLILEKNIRLYNEEIKSLPKRRYDIGPSGKIREGESKHQAAMRQIREETGINDLTLDPRFVGAYRYEFHAINRMDGPLKGEKVRVRKTRLFYLAVADVQQVMGNVKLTAEHLSSKLVPLANAVDMKILHLNQRRTLERLKGYLRDGRAQTFT